MLGCEILDVHGVEEGGSMRGMELLPVTTTLQETKKLCQSKGVIGKLSGIFEKISGCAYEGYEIHMGETVFVGKESAQAEQNVVVSAPNQNIYGSYVHGLFDAGDMANIIVQVLAEKKGLPMEHESFLDYRTFKEKQYAKLADTLREYLNMEEIYGMLREAHLE